MKDIIQIMVVFAILLTVIPSIVFLNADGAEQNVSAKMSDTADIAVYFTETGKTENYTLEEYMIGSVLAQMPSDFDEEALKAQAVLAHTYINRRMLTESQSPTAALNGALISDDANLYQGFFTEKAAKEYYGDDYESAYKKVKKAVDEVSDEILTYEGEPIIVAFHAASSGYTQSAKAAWGEDIPYLQSVKSESDKNLEGAECTATLTAEDLEEKLSQVFPEIEFTELSSANDWLQTKRDDTGYVISLTVCGSAVDPNRFCEILDISSPCFEYEFRNTKFTFKSKGFGHLVGMSQYGANSMSKEGADHKDILSHYFPQTKLITENAPDA